VIDGPQGGVEEPRRTVLVKIGMKVSEGRAQAGEEGSHTSGSKVQSFHQNDMPYELLVVLFTKDAMKSDQIRVHSPKVDKGSRKDCERSLLTDGRVWKTTALSAAQKR